MVMVINLMVSFSNFFLEAKVLTFLTDLFFCPSKCQGYNQRYEKQSYGGYGKKGYGHRNQGNRLTRYFFFVNCNVRLISDLFLFQDTCLNNRTRRDTKKKDTATTNKVTIS